MAIPCKHCHKVKAAKVHRPTGLIVTSWFKTWVVKCGCCRRDFIQFRLFGPLLKCPYCSAKNVVALLKGN